MELTSCLYSQGFRFSEPKRSKKLLSLKIRCLVLSVRSLSKNLLPLGSVGVSSRKRVQRYGDFLNWQNLLGLFFQKLSKYRLEDSFSALSEKMCIKKALTPCQQVASGVAAIDAMIAVGIDLHV